MDMAVKGTYFEAMKDAYEEFVKLEDLKDAPPFEEVLPLIGIIDKLPEPTITDWFLLVRNRLSKWLQTFYKLLNPETQIENYEAKKVDKRDLEKILVAIHRLSAESDVALIEAMEKCDERILWKFFCKLVEEWKELFPTCLLYTSDAADE